MPKKPKRRSEPGAALDDLLQLGATWAAVTRVLERELGGVGISLPQALVLLQIAAVREPLLLSQVATRLLQQPQSMTSLMDRVEQAGWARRVHDLPDRRAIRVELTEAGVARANEVGPRMLAAAGHVLAPVDSSVRGELAAGVTALYKACRLQPGVRLPALVDGDAAAPVAGSE